MWRVCPEARSLILLAVTAGALRAQSVADIRQSVSLAMPALTQSAATFVAKRACLSCHHNILPVLMLHMAQDRGLRFDGAVLESVEAKTFRSLRGPNAFDDAVQAVTLNDPTPDDSYLLMAAHAAGYEPNLTAGVYARRLAQWQRDGHWVTSDFRPPHSSSVFTATATAVRAIGLYMPVALKAERDTRILKAREWLVREKPRSTEDAAFRLLGLVWAGASTGELVAAQRDLVVMRMPSGGWPELRGYLPDAYSTGESLYALRESGMASSDRVFSAGLRFLLKTQARDGTWRVHTRMVSPADVSPEYFPTGFPYEKDEFLSYAGSIWASMALMSALPVAPAARQALQLETSAPKWAATMLFGTVGEVAALLDSGFDPNSRTERGTNALMMAATDTEKVSLLLARGAEPKARAISGVDALTIAAASRDTSGALQSLLAAGAEPNVTDGVRSKNSPLLLASMTGDLANAKVLLDHGARFGSALSQAVTFGYADLVRVLIDAGAPAKLTENTGINLLHWAVIANRPQVIPLLVAAGVSVNAQDDFDFTPLMYAATIDFGDTASLQALLNAGADLNIRNAAGRTALEQAHYFKHVNLESVLRNQKH